MYTTGEGRGEMSNKSATSMPTRGQHIPNPFTIKSRCRENNPFLERWASGIDKLGFLDKPEFTLALHAPEKYQELYFF